MVKAKTMLPLVALAAICSGCWPFNHGETPQQDFVQALRHGNSAQASEIWLKMSLEDRLKLQRGQGIGRKKIAGDAGEKNPMTSVEQGSGIYPQGESAGVPQLQNTPDAAPSTQSRPEPPAASVSSPFFAVNPGIAR
ncbi:MAG: hypothetical protein ACREP6_07920 [Candidatus Binataceae bacterium]